VDETVDFGAQLRKDIYPQLLVFQAHYLQTAEIPSGVDQR
jgi:hypothetical protein